LEESLIYSHRIQPIQLYCAADLPNQLAALGFNFPGQLYGFLNEALVNVRRGEHRYLQALNHDIPSDSVGPLVSVHGKGKRPHLVGLYSHRYGKTSFFKSLDHTSCNWIRKRITEAQRYG
uniref:YcaO domain-containing protein n=1 Tax=Rodentolepis nana TaxID=102285 RepID=A0A0R3TU45_RODNA